MILAENRLTDYKIVTALDATEVEIHAAEELRFFLERITGSLFQM